MVANKFLDPKNDVVFHRIFGTEKNKDILIHFINDILEYQGSERIVHIEFLPTIQVPEIAVKKQSIVDVMCQNEKGEKIIVEMQASPQQGFEKRAQYYAAKAYCGQLNKGQEEGGRYIDLKAVIFIAIVDNIVFKDKEEYMSHHIILDKETYTQDLKDFSFTFIELPKFKIKQPEELKTIVEKWCYFFKYGERTHEKELVKIVGEDKVIEKAYEELNYFNWNEIELRTYEKEIKRIMDNQAAEDYIIDKAKTEGRAEGMAQGIEKGMAQGIEKGRAEGKKEEVLLIARKMLDDGFDIATIIKITGCTEDEVKALVVA